jgi:NADH dehydrogenase FAD-containing subunit
MKVVIVGGGFCGSLVAKRLHSHHDIESTLIDSKPYFEYYPSLAKMLFKPSYLEKITVPFTSFLDESQVVTAPMVSVTPECVLTADATFPYDALVLSPGIQYPIFLKSKKSVATIRSGAELAALHDSVAKAKSVVIIGGGLIGTELAAEFATRMPELKVTMVHVMPRLLERNSLSVSRYALRFLEDRGVSVIFGEKVVSHHGQTFTTDAGREISADLGFWCAGIKADPSFLEGFSEEVVGEHGYLVVDEHLRLKGYPKVFVGGDLVGISEEKNAAHANTHAGVIIENIRRMQQKKSLVSYRSRHEPVDISLGSWDGIIIVPPFVLVGFIPGIVKQAVEKIAVARLRL